MDPELKWDSEKRCLHYDEILRCFPSNLTNWRRRPPSSRAIIRHATNPHGECPIRWWNAQATLYGYRPDWHDLDKVIHKFKSIVGGGRLSLSCVWYNVRSGHSLTS
jgi:hypothetical protein